MEFSGMVVAHVYPEYMMSAAISCYLLLEPDAARDGVHVRNGNGS